MPLIRQGGWILAVALLGWLLYLLHPVLAPFLAGIAGVVFGWFTAMAPTITMPPIIKAAGSRL